MSSLQEVLAEKIAIRRDRIQNLVKKHSDEIISQITLQQLCGGLRGVQALICDLDSSVLFEVIR